MKKLLYLPVLIGTLLFLGCEKDDDPQDDAGNYQTPLPAATTYGAGTFACYVDGKAYIAKIQGYNYPVSQLYGRPGCGICLCRYYNKLQSRNWQRR